MPLFKKEPSPSKGGAIAPGAGSNGALDSFLQGLDGEIWRARRYDRPLSVVAARPRLLPSERLSPAEITFAAHLVREVLRRSDVAAWVDGASIVGVLPETGAGQARSAAYRLRSELERRTISERRLNWRVASVSLRDEQFARDLLDALLTELADDVD